MDSRLFSEVKVFCFLFSKGKRALLLDALHPASVGIRALTYPSLVVDVWDGSNSDDKKLSKYYVTYN